MSTLSFYNKSIRKITTSFASLFNNIFLIRYNEDGTENQRIVVPIVFADQEKYQKRLLGDPNLDKKIQITLPRLSYELTNIRYDSSRKLNTNNKNFVYNEDKMFYQFNPVPYDFDFNLTLYTRNIEDGNQILEQIIPYFTPDYTIKVNMVPEMDITRNIPIILTNISPSIESTGLFNSETRAVYWGLSFTAKGYIFGAIKEAPQIKHVKVSVNQITSSLLEFTSSAGNFEIGEVVYQGINLENANAYGKVVLWDGVNNLLTINQQYGLFIDNQPVVGKSTIKLLKKTQELKSSSSVKTIELLFDGNAGFKVGEVIYQGSLSNKTASAVVSSWILILIYWNWGNYLENLWRIDLYME